jgi:hypothetical protein
MVSTPVHAEDNVQINVLSKDERLIQQKLQIIEEGKSLNSDYTKGRGEEGNEGTVLGKKKKGNRPKVKAPNVDERGAEPKVAATPAKSTPAPASATPAASTPSKDKPKELTGPKGYDGLWDVLTAERASYALGISWLTWNTVYIGLALFSAGSILVFPILYSVLLPPPSTVDDMGD